MPKHIIKLSYKDDIRRLTLSENEQNIQSLKSIVSELYNLDVSEFNIKYFDEDNDIITLGTDQDLHDAISYLSQNARYSRLYVGVRGEEYDFTQSSLMSSTYGQNSLVASRFMGIQPTGPDYAKLSTLMSPGGLPTQPTPLEQNNDKSNYSSYDKPIQNNNSNNFYVPTQPSYPPTSVPMVSPMYPSTNPPMNSLMNPPMNPSMNSGGIGVQPFSGQQESNVPQYPPVQNYPQPTFNNNYNNNIIPNEPKVQDKKPDSPPPIRVPSPVKQPDSPPPIRVPSPKIVRKPEPEYKIGEESIAAFEIILPPGETTTKNWTIVNIGDCTWPNDLYLEYNNQKLNSDIPALEPGKKTTIDIAVTAPSYLGTEQRLYSIKHNNKTLLNLSPVMINVQEEEEEEEEFDMGEDKYKNVSREAVQNIVDMGFDEDVAIEALTESSNNFEVALDLLLNG